MFKTLKLRLSTKSGRLIELDYDIRNLLENPNSTAEEVQLGDITLQKREDSDTAYIGVVDKIDEEGIWQKNYYAVDIYTGKTRFNRHIASSPKSHHQHILYSGSKA